MEEHSKQLPEASENISSKSPQLNLDGLNQEEWIHFNVGGTRFDTTFSTLFKKERSFFHGLATHFKELKPKCDSSGAVLIDRDPEYFRPVLNYLRTGKFILDKNLSAEGVLEEAEFFNLPELCELILKHIIKRDADAIKKLQAQKPSQLVYRVLQSSQDSELSNLLSTLPDGWRIEQILKTDPSYNKGVQKEEFLIVVSATETTAKNELSEKGKQIQELANRN